MLQVDFTICGSQVPPQLVDILGLFTAKSSPKASVQVHPMPWESYKQELTTMAIYKRGGDISQVGAPVVNDLVAMNALRPFTAREVALLGGESAFSPVVWQSSQRVSEGKVWAIPWLADPHTILYWCDMLEKAGVDEQTAFQTFEQMEETLQRLEASGIAAPLILVTGQKYGTIHAVSPWIWGKGGDFVSADGKKALFLQPQALAGLRAYFDLYRYMPQEGVLWGDEAAYQQFSKRRAAVTFTNMASVLGLLEAFPDLSSRLGVALPPGPPLVGSSSLVIWEHSLRDELAVNLVRYLTGREAQVAYSYGVGYLPVRLDALNDPPYSTDPLLRDFVRVLHKGRVFPLIHLGGMLEEKLGNALCNVWKEIIINPKADPEATIIQMLDPIARRFEQWAD